MKKRLLSLLLVVAMVFTMMPAIALPVAAEPVTAKCFADGTEVRMEYGASYTFTGASVAVTATSTTGVVTLDGNTITAAAAGYATVTVDGVDYTVAVLPEGYTLLYYLEADNAPDGTQAVAYFDSDYLINAETCIDIKTIDTGSVANLFSSAVVNKFGFLWNKSKIGLTSVGGVFSNWTYFLASPYVHVVIKNGKQYINGMKVGSVAYSSYFSTMSATVFAMKDLNGYTQTYGGHGKIVSLRVSEKDNLKRYYVPSVDENGFYGMYDMVTGAFKISEGTGSFSGSVEKQTDILNIAIESDAYVTLPDFWNAKSGDTVSIPVKVKAGLEMRDIKVLKASDRTDITSTVNVSYSSSEQQISFTMPSEEVILNVSSAVTSLFYHDKATISDISNEDTNVGISNVSGTNYLFLPSTANYEELPLVAPAGTVLTGTAEGKQITFTEDRSAVYDVTELFEETMIDGTQYDLSVTYPEQSSISVKMVKSANVLTTFITSDKSIASINDSKSNVGTGTITVLNSNCKKLYDGDLDSIKGRGTASWSHISEQKGYDIQLSNESELISGAGEAKKWCLISGDMYSEGATWVSENPMMIQMTGYQLYKDLGGAYNFEYQPTDLYVNGEYRGTYLLVEAVQINEARVDITETEYETEGTSITTDTINVTANGVENTVYARWSDNAELGDNPSGGFILEMDDSPDSKSDCFFYTAYNNRYLFKEPDMPTKAQVETIAQYVQDYEDALYADSGYNSKGKYYAEYIDLDSMAIEFATATIMCDGDSFFKSEYFTIDVDDEGNYLPIIAAPTWDFDATEMGKDSNWDSIMGYMGNSNGTWFIHQYLKHADFVAKADTVLNGIGKTTVENYLADDGLIDTFITTYSTAKAVSRLRWPSSRYDFNADANTKRSAACFKKEFASWVNTFYTVTWKDSALRGASVAYDKASKKLVVTPNTTDNASTYQWYTVDVSTGELTAVEDATSAELENPTVDTVYEVAVTASDGNVIKSYTPRSIYKTAGLFDSLAAEKTAASIQFSAPIGVVTASFDMQGHGTQVEAQTLIMGGKVTQPDAPIADGYTFCGWYKEPECLNKWDFANDTVGDEPVTLYALWLQKDKVYRISTAGYTKYDTLAGALTAAAAGDTVVPMGDVTEKGTFVIQPDVTLDLNGYTVDVDTVLSFGIIKDTGADGTGKLILSSPKNLTYNLDEAKLGSAKDKSDTEGTYSDIAVLPVWSSTESCYTFYPVERIGQIWQNELSSGNPKYVFQIRAEDVDAILADNSEVELYIQLDYVIDIEGNDCNRTAIYKVGRDLVEYFLEKPSNRALTISFGGTEGISVMNGHTFFKAEQCNFTIGSKAITTSAS